MLTLKKTFKKIKPYFRQFLLLLAYLFIFTAIIASFFRALTPIAARYKPQFETFLSRFIGEPVKIGEIKTGWYWFEPTIQAKKLRIEAKGEQPFKVQKIELGMDLWRSLLNRRFQPGLLYVDGISLSVTQSKNGFKLDNQFAQASNTDSSQALNEVLAVILGHQTIQLRHVNLNLNACLPNTRCAKSEMIALKNINTTLMHRFGTYRLKGEAELSAPKAQFQFASELRVKPDAPEQASGRLYFKANDFSVPIDWIAAYLPEGIHLKKAELGGALWGDVVLGQLQSVQGELNLSNLSWADESLKKKSTLRQCLGLFKWKRTPEGYELSGSKIHIQDKAGLWPETAFILKVDTVKTAYDLGIQTLDLGRVLKLPIPLPEALQAWKERALSGKLDSLQLHYTPASCSQAPDGQTTPVSCQANNEFHVLTQFSDVGWQASKAWPEVKALKGVLQWAPGRGHIMIDSPQLEVTAKQSPLILFSMFNADMNWLKTAEGTEFKLKHFAAKSEHLKMKAKGSYAEQTDTLDLHSRFELIDGTFWLNYLPKKQLKPKLYEWLKNDIHRLDSGIGALTIQGPWKHFPFDKDEGIFKIDTELNGVDLSYAPGWPEAKEIKGRLSLDKRKLTANIYQAKVLNASLNAVSLEVGSLGLDKERLLIHGVANRALANEAWQVVLDSPLGNKRPIFHSMAWQGYLGLDLLIDASLNASSDDFLVKGEVGLDDNHLQLNEPAFHLQFKALNGTLNFNEKGLLDSELMTRLWKKKTPVHIQTDTQGTSLKLAANPKVEDVFEIFNSSAVSGIKGSLPVDAHLYFPSSEKSTESLSLYSDLRGLDIAFPPFLVKPADKPEVFRTNVQFGKGQDLNILLQYSDILQAKRLPGQAWNIKSDLPLLQANLKYDPAARFISGEIESVNVQTFSSSFSGENKPNTLRPIDLPSLYLIVKDLSYGDWSLGKLTVQAQSARQKYHISAWQLSAPEYEIHGKGNWYQMGAKDESQLSAYFSAPDIRRVLKAWDLPVVLETGKTYLSAKLNWTGALWQFAFDKVDGEVKAKMKNGRTMHFDKQTESKLGLAKLLSIFSLQTIPRRLQLDFSDLSHDGYTFDTFVGEFKMRKGILQTESCTVDGPAASSTVHGNIDFVNQLYDLILKVNPHVTASLPVVATLAGGPVAGAATWIASQMLSKGVNHISAYTYRITGPWKEPVVEPLKLYQKS